MSRLMRDGMAEPVSRDEIIRHVVVVYLTLSDPLRSSRGHKIDGTKLNQTGNRR